MPTTSVFISSTSQDLRDHRSAVREALLDHGYHPIDMADFGARDDGATSACLEEVADADLFVGIYAWRYGFIPPGSSTSITEQEYDEAQRLGKPCFCFTIDDTHAWPDELREGGESAELLRAFKARIDAERVRTTFTTPDNLALKVGSSLTRWEKKQHKLTYEAASELLAGVSSLDDANQLVGEMLEAQEVEFEFEDGVFIIPKGSILLEVESFVHEHLGLMVDFRAPLAQQIDLERVPPEVALNFLAFNSTIPLGGLGLDVNSSTIHYRYSLPGTMLTPETAFDCIRFVATTADEIDEQIQELLPTRSRSKWQR